MRPAPIRSWAAAAALAALLHAPAPAYSSAENAAQHQPELHPGYLALGKPGAVASLEALRKPERIESLLATAGIRDLSAFTIEVDGQTLLFRHHTVRKGADPAALWARAAAGKSLGPWIAQWDALVGPPPGAAAGASWLRLEQVFYHRGPADRKPGAQSRRLAAITGLKPEMEMQYRTLHQTGWPGVLDALDRSQVANFSLYLFALGEKLYLIYYFDYLGDDFEADMAAMGQDAVTRRWWKFTDACQQPLPDAAAKKQIWTDLKPLN